MPDTPEHRDYETILAFDFGLRRIGVAVGQSVTASATPLGIIDNAAHGVDRRELAALIAEWHPLRLIVGLPLHADGSWSEMQKPLQHFIEELETFGLPVETVDERYTSLEAESRLREARAAGRRRRVSKAAVDAAAAALIAERYLARRRASV